MEIPSEEWRPCPQFPKYQVSSLGRFRNVRTGHIKAKHINHRDGYLFLRLYDQATNERTVRSAPLICEAFHGPKPEGELVQVDHVDQDKLNERADNLQWTDQSTNVRKSYERGERNKGNDPIGMTPAQHAAIHIIWKTGKWSQVEISRVLGCTNSSISRIVNGIKGPRDTTPPDPADVALLVTSYTQQLEARAQVSKGRLRKLRVTRGYHRKLSPLLDLMRANPNLTMDQACKELGWYRTTLRRGLRYLRRKGVIVAHRIIGLPNRWQIVGELTATA